MTEPVAEVYKDIPGYEGIYQVSNLGNVVGLERKNSIGKSVHFKLLKQNINRDGYLKVSLSKNGHKTTIPVHRLVANSFIENPLNLSDVNHKDEDKTNNNVENLEWMTHFDNMHYGTGMQRKTQSQSFNITAIDADGNKNYFSSQIEAAKKLGISDSSISRVIKGEWKQVKGYTFILTEAVQLPVEEQL